MVKKYKKKPVIIEAVQWTGHNKVEILEFTGMDGICLFYNNGLTIKTLEGSMFASNGDYIIKGVHGEFYPCKPDIFDETYELAEYPSEEFKDPKQDGSDLSDAEIILRLSNRCIALTDGNTCKICTIKDRCPVYMDISGREKDRD